MFPVSTRSDQTSDSSRPTLVVVDEAWWLMRHADTVAYLFRLVYIDEFQKFLGIAGPFGDALAQARSLRLSLTIANQHLGQLPREFREAVRANARSRMVFQCGHDDAASLSREFAPLDATALLSLARFEAAARLSIAGHTSAPFTLRTAPAAAVTKGSICDEIVAASRDRYGRPVAEIDAALEAALGKSSAAVRKRVGDERDVES